MDKGRKPTRKALTRSAIAAFIGAAFLTLTVAGASAADLSLIESVKGFFGITSNVALEQTNSSLDASNRVTASTTFVISQAYGGGGGSTGTYLNDYVELKNISSSPQSLAGLSLMYGSATGQFASSATNAYALTGGTVQPGQYYLVQLGPVGTAGAPLPVTPDETTTNLSMSGTNGKVALVTAALAPNTCGATATPCVLPNPAIIDLVAWGTANNAEGGASTNAGASLTSVQGNVRKNNGCTDTDNNNADFDIITAPVPHNTTTTTSCSGGPTPTFTATSTGSPTPTNTATASSTATFTPSASPSPVQGGTLVISQFDGGGGGATGTYLNDYVEIKNVSNASQSLNGLSLYYGSATGNFASTATNAFALPNVSLAPGQYFLVQLGPTGTAGAPLPTPDATTTNLTMSGASGKIALVTAGLATNTCGATATPCDATQLSFIVDWAAYGVGGNGTPGNGEGGTSVNNNTAMTSTQGGVRKVNGCQDTNNNNNDFDVVTAPVPRNMSSSPVTCAGGPSGTPTSTFTPTPSSTSTNTATSTPTTTSTATATNTQTATPSGSPTATPSCIASTNLVGSQEVPPTGSTATGIGTVTLSSDNTQITINLSWSGLTSNAISAHIHGPAAAGTNAAILFGLSGVPSATTGAIPAQTVNVTPTQVAQLRAGLFYFNVHSANFSGGEIRGQILPNCSVRGDFDGDGKSDVSVFRPSQGNWYQNRTNLGLTATNFGLNGDVPVPGDYDGDGKTDVAVYRGDSTDSHPDFFVLNSATNTVSYAFWGLDTDVPVTGDYNGDGKADFTVYRPSTGFWYILQTGGGVQALAFGASGDLPMYMDYNGDGKANLAVFRPSNGTWYIAKPTGVPAQNFDAVQWGTNGDIPVPADYDGDHKDDIAVFRPSNGTWYAIFSTTGQFASEQFGINGDIPVPADYDGDSKADVAVYRNGIWYQDLTDSTFIGVSYGLPTDIPIQSKYHP